MIIIGITFYILIAVGVIAFLTFILPAFITVTREEKGKPPRIISYVILGLFVFHWIFFLMSGYALLPAHVADAVFIPAWLALCVAGAVTAIYEFKNNKVFAFPLAGVTTISFILTFMSFGISKM